MARDRSYEHRFHRDASIRENLGSALFYKLIIIDVEVCTNCTIAPTHHCTWHGYVATESLSTLHSTIITLILISLIVRMLIIIIIIIIAMIIIITATTTVARITTKESSEACLARNGRFNDLKSLVYKLSYCRSRILRIVDYILANIVRKGQASALTNAQASDKHPRRMKPGYFRTYTTSSLPTYVYMSFTRSRNAFYAVPTLVTLLPTVG